MIICSNEECEDWVSMGRFMSLMEGYDRFRQRNVICSKCNHVAIKVYIKESRVSRIKERKGGEGWKSQKKN